MRKRYFLYFAPVSFLMLSVVGAGCLSVSDSPSPRLYMPRALDKQEIGETYSLPPGLIIGVGPVRVPEYLSRPQMVTREKNGLLNFAQFDRWGESLDLAILRLLDEDLSLLLPQSSIMKFTWNISTPVKYQVAVDIIQMESQLDKDLTLVISWSVIDLDTKLLIFNKRTEISCPIEPHNYFGLSKALSAACATLSRQIAQELVVIANQAGLELKD